MAPRGYRKFRFRLWRRRLKARYRSRVARQPDEKQVYEEPADHARDEAYEILAQARQTAAEIVQSAQQRADSILAAARTQAQFLTAETRNLSQEFLDDLRGLGQRLPDALQSDDPMEMLRRLSASPPARPDVPTEHGEPGPRSNGSANGADANGTPDANGTADAYGTTGANGRAEGNGSAEAAAARFWGSAPAQGPYSSSP